MAQSERLFQSVNLTCQSPPSHSVIDYLSNRSECRLSESELSWEILMTFHAPLVLCCSGIALNLVNFCVLRRPQFEGLAYKYMAAISLVDALFLLVYTAYVASAQRCEDHSGRFPCSWLPFLRSRYYLSAASVYFANTLNFTLQTVCAWLSVALGLERYLAMRSCQIRPGASRRCRAGSPGAIAGFVVASVSLASLALNLPTSFAMRTAAKELPPPATMPNDTSILVRTIEATEFGKSALYSGYSLVKLIATSLLPAVVLGVTNSALLVQVVSLRRKNLRRKNTGYSSRTTKIIQATQNRLLAQRNLTILLIAVIFVFLCGQVPRSLLFKEVFSLLYSGCPCGSALLWICCPLYRRLHPICELVYLLCLNLNFFLYAGLNEHFREQLRSAASYVCGCYCDPPAAAQRADDDEDHRVHDDEDDLDMDLFSAAGATTIGCSQQQQQHQQQPASHSEEDHEDGNNDESKKFVVSEL